MQLDRLQGIIVVFAFIFILAIGFSLLGYNWFVHTDSTGNLKDSPFFYVIMLVALAFIVLILKVKNEAQEQGRISIPMFINVVISGIAVGGIIHEFVHVLLLQHATQLRLHFGDPTAIFSTCCLLPGELANEEIAYAVQFLITIGWIIYFEKFFYDKNDKPQPKKSKWGTDPTNAHNADLHSSSFSVEHLKVPVRGEPPKKVSGEIDAEDLDDERRQRERATPNDELNGFLGELEKTKVQRKR
jgi:hypothetical protein